MSIDFTERVRRLRNAVEPVAAGVYFAPEAHAGYEALGFAGSPVTQDGVARPELKAYFTGRGACMGQVTGDVVAAAFGCFNPKVVAPAVEAGWQITSRQAVLDAREQAATAMLQRVLGDRPEGLFRPGRGGVRPAEPSSGLPVCDVSRPSRSGEPAWPRPGSPTPLRIENAALHGAWGLTIEWNDGHATGIFAFEWLRRWHEDGAAYGPDSGLGGLGD